MIYNFLKHVLLISDAIAAVRCSVNQILNIFIKPEKALDEPSNIVIGRIKNSGSLILNKNASDFAYSFFSKMFGSDKAWIKGIINAIVRLSNIPDKAVQKIKKISCLFLF